MATPNTNDEDKLSKEDILKVPGLSFYCRNCEGIVTATVDPKDKKYICQSCKQKAIVIGRESGLTDYFKTKR